MTDAPSAFTRPSTRATLLERLKSSNQTWNGIETLIYYLSNDPALASRKDAQEAVERWRASTAALSREAVVETYFAMLERAPPIGNVRKRLSLDVLDALRKAERVLVICGAGISTSAGIPDFRSKGGIYDTVKASGEKLDDPHLLFDATQFKVDPAPFFRQAFRILGSSAAGGPSPTICHRFLARLEGSGKLQRLYTQNIDDLEFKAGSKRVVQCHGTLATSTCTKCAKKQATNLAGPEIARCDACPEGVLKPDITFFGQDLPRDYVENIDKDLCSADFVVVMGSSLKVKPVCGILGRIPSHTPTLLVNRETVGAPHEFDRELLGSCDEICAWLEKELFGSEGEAASESVLAAPRMVLPHRFVFKDAVFEEEEDVKPPAARAESDAPAAHRPVPERPARAAREATKQQVLARQTPIQGTAAKRVQLAKDSSKKTPASKPLGPAETKAFVNLLRAAAKKAGPKLAPWTPDAWVGTELDKARPKSLALKSPAEMSSLMICMSEVCNALLATGGQAGLDVDAMRAAAGEEAAAASLKRETWKDHGLDAVWAQAFRELCNKFIAP